MTGKAYPVTPDGRYFVVRGRLWRRSNPDLAEIDRDRRVHDLMAARRAVHLARQAGDEAAVAHAHAAVDIATRALGERGPVWWDDGAPDFNRHMARTTPYADWFANLAQDPFTPYAVIMKTTDLTIDVPDVGAVSGLWQAPPTVKATLVLAHGAGANMTHRSMAAIADGLGDLGVATLRYQFPYMEKGGKRPDTPAVAQATVRAAVAVAQEHAGQSPLFAGGRSFGGRMTSGAQAAEPLAGVRGLVFFAFPLHLAGKPAVTRADHLADIKIPMLFLSGSKDALAELDLLEQTVARLKDAATLELIPDADHSFHVPKRTGRSDVEVLGAALVSAVRWMADAAR